MRYTQRKVRSGLTLIELIIAAAIGLIIVLILGMLLASGHRNWLNTFDQSNRGIEIDALQTMMTFGSFGRQANKMDYAVYTVGNGNYLRAKPAAATPVQVVTGQAAEFRYWGVELNKVNANLYGLMESTKTATNYMLFYLDGTTLKVDRGTYVIGADPDLNGLDNYGGVANNGTTRLTGGTTQVLAENVTALQFSHTTQNGQGDGKGCVRLNMTLTDPADGRTITVTTATLLRNVWGMTPVHN
jgi:Tfp pilus assembly protein PilV